MYSIYVICSVCVCYVYIFLVCVCDVYVYVICCVWCVYILCSVCDIYIYIYAYIHTHTYTYIPHIHSYLTCDIKSFIFLFWFESSVCNSVTDLLDFDWLLFRFIFIVSISACRWEAGLRFDRRFVKIPLSVELGEHFISFQFISNFFLLIALQKTATQNLSLFLFQHGFFYWSQNTK